MHFSLTFYQSLFMILIMMESISQKMRSHHFVSILAFLGLIALASYLLFLSNVSYEDCRRSESNLRTENHRFRKENRDFCQMTRNHEVFQVAVPFANRYRANGQYMTKEKIITNFEKCVNDSMVTRIETNINCFD